VYSPKLELELLEQDLPPGTTQDDVHTQDMVSMSVDLSGKKGGKKHDGPDTSRLVDAQVAEWVGAMTAAGWPAEGRVEAVKAKGNHAYGASDREAALRLYSHALELSGDGLGSRSRTAAALYHNRSKVHAELGNWEASASDARMSVLINDSYAKGYYRWAVAAKELGQPGRALALANQGMNMCMAAEDGYRNPVLTDLMKSLAADISAMGVEKLDMFQRSILSTLPGTEALTGLAAEGPGLAALLRISDSKLVAMGPAKLARCVSATEFSELMCTITEAQTCLTPGAAAACRLLSHMKMPAIARQLVEDWPTFLRGEADEHGDHKYLWREDGSGPGPFCQLIMADPDCVEPLLYMLGNDCSLVWPNLLRNKKSFSQQGIGLEAQNMVLISVWEMSLPIQCGRRAIALRCLSHLAEHGRLSAAEVDRVVEVTATLLRSVWDASCSRGFSLALNRFKRHLQRMMSQAVGLLLALHKAGHGEQAARAIPSLRAAAMLDLLDLNCHGDWTAILARFDLAPEGGLDAALALDASRLARGRRLATELRMLRAAALDPANWRTPKCTNYYCAAVGSAKTPLSAACGKCAAPYCSEECLQEDAARLSHPANICALGKRACYEVTGPDEAEERCLAPAGARAEPEGGLWACDCCGLLETYTRKFEKCARCRAVRYCSTMCQKVAWRRLGHRTVCSQP